MTNEELTMSNEEAKKIIIQERDSLKANPAVKVENCLYEAFDVAIKALEQTELNPNYNGVKTELEDCISRYDLNDAISELTYWHFEDGHLVVGGGGSKYETVYKVDDVVRVPDVLPSVTPQPKVGKWIKTYEPNDAEPCILWMCSECQNTERGRRSKYCPNCGCRMKGEGE